jgi:hypothetical protein
MDSLSRGGRGLEGLTYIPLRLELLEPHKRLCHRLVGKDGLVLLQRPLAYLGVIRFGDSIFEEGLLQLVQGDDDAEYLS